jgi:hypothetical protein
MIPTARFGKPPHRMNTSGTQQWPLARLAATGCHADSRGALLMERLFGGRAAQEVIAGMPG